MVAHILNPSTWEAPAFDPSTRTQLKGTSKLKGLAELQVTKGKRQRAGKEKARLLEMLRNNGREEREVLPGQEDQSQSPGGTEDAGVSSGKDLARVSYVNPNKVKVYDLQPN